MLCGLFWCCIAGLGRSWHVYLFSSAFWASILPTINREAEVSYMERRGVHACAGADEERGKDAYG